jgi:NagD protein
LYNSIVAGISSEIDPVLVLSGVTEMSDLTLFAYHPFVILGGVYEIPNDDDKNKITEEDLEESSRRVSKKYGFVFLGFFLY